MKQTLEIKRFLSGIISAPAEADIPVDAASYSLNVDPTVEDGKLGGIPDDTTKKSSVNATALALLEGESTWTALYVDTAATAIKGVSDFYGTPGTASFTGTATVSPTIANPVIQVWNKAAHIGLGPDENDPPKFVGYIDTTQLDNAAPSGLQIEDAEIRAPGGEPALYKIVRNGSVCFGIEWQGKYLYRISATGAITRSKAVFDSTQGICLDYGDDDTLWLYDNNANTEFGIVYKIDNTAFTDSESDPVDFILFTSRITNLPGGAGMGDVSDIECSENNLWFAHYHSTNAGDGDGKVLLSNAPTPTASGDLTSASDKSVGNLDAASIGRYAAPKDITTFKACLFKPKSGGPYIGWIADFNDVGIYIDAVPTSYQFKLTAVITHEDFTSGDTKFQDTAGDSCVPRQLVDDAAAKIGLDLYGVSQSNLSHSTNGLVASVYNSATSFTLHHFDHTNTAGGGALGSGGSGITVPAQISEDIDTTVFVASANIAASESAGVYSYTLSGTGSSYTHANGTFTTSDFSALANLVLSDVSILAENTSIALTADSGFVTTKRYFYKASYIYDGSQESPLSLFTGSVVPAFDDRAIRVTVTIRSSAALSKRITALNIYRGDSNDTSSNSPGTFYRLVATLPLDYTQFRDTETTIAAELSAYCVDRAVTGVTYEANSGLPESLERSIVHYGLAYTMNSEMVVGQCWVPEVPDSERMLFKSLPGQLDSFNTIDTFVLLKAKPTAVCGYNGRFYGFDTGRIYRVNPNPFVIEDVFEGVGCAWATAVVSTEYGMFHADENGIYRHNGQSPEMLSYAVRDLWALKVTSSYAPKLVFDSVRRCLLVFHAIAGPAYRVLAYSLVHQAWWYWETVLPKAILRGKDGEIYVSNGTDLIEYLGGTGFRAYDWWSKQLTAGNDSIKKRWFSTRVQAEGTSGTWTGTLSFLADGSAVSPTTDHDGETFRFIHKAWAEKFQIKLADMPGNDLIDSFGINIRQKVVTG